MANANIMIVEDENIVAMNLKERLKNMGYAVCAVAFSGEAAVKKAGEKRPDLVLMDIKLKGDMDGIEAAGQIRLRFDIPVIYLTAYSDSDTLKRAKITEPFGYILKPMQERELQISIEMALYKHNMEQKLKEEHNLLRTVIDSVPDYIYVKDLKSRFLLYNNACQRILGKVKPDKVIGKTDFELYSQKYAEQYFADEQEIFQTGQPLINKEESVIDHKGNTRWVLTTKVPLKDNQGKVLGLVGVNRDITEHKRAGRLLRALNETALAIEKAMTPEEIFSTIAEAFKQSNLYCVVSLMDKRQENLITEYLSYDLSILQSVEKLTGFNAIGFKIHIADIDILKKLAGARKAVFIKDVEAIVRQLFPDPQNILARQILKTMKITKCIVAPLIVEDKVIGLLSVQSEDLSEGDVSAITAFANQMAVTLHKSKLMQELEQSLAELKNTQDQLVHSQKMEAIGRLAGGVAHDYNNLLTAIMGYTELLLGDPRAEGTMRGDLEEIRKASERATSLTRQLLAFSRRQPLQPKVLNLTDIVVNMNEMLQRLIGEDVRLNTFFAPEPGLVKVDPGQIEQVIMRLAVNAHEAMPDGGQLTIRTENVTIDENYSKVISYSRPGKFVCLSIEDNGCGMDKTTAEQIFEPFFSTKGKAETSGLGLAVVYGIIRQHEGWINVYSEPELGSVFKIYLPALAKTSTDEIEVKISLKEFQGKGERILLVEDEETIREFAKRLLRKNGYSVFESVSVEEAITVFEKEKGQFHLLFSDVVLPDKSGLQLTEELLSRKPGLKILLSSGYTDQKSQWLLIREKGFRFLQKPYALTDLLVAVRETILSGK